MVSDLTVMQDVVEELDFEPSLDASLIEVAVCEGIVTLSGQVTEHLYKLMAEAAVFRVSGVAGIVQELDVLIVDRQIDDDACLRQRIMDLLRWNAMNRQGTIRVHVHDGWVLLRGSVEWQFQREAAVDLVNRLQGVRGVLDQIGLLPAPPARDAASRIERALSRNICSRYASLVVNVDHSKVTLEGSVSSWLQRAMIRQLVWSLTGVTVLVDHMRQL